MPFLRPAQAKDDFHEAVFYGLAHFSPKTKQSKTKKHVLDLVPHLWHYWEVVEPFRGRI
jgi:hypothetical protein